MTKEELKDRLEGKTIENQLRELLRFSLEKRFSLQVSELKIRLFLI